MSWLSDKVNSAVKAANQATQAIANTVVEKATDAVELAKATVDPTYVDSRNRAAIGNTQAERDAEGARLKRSSETNAAAITAANYAETGLKVAQKVNNVALVVTATAVTGGTGTGAAIAFTKALDTGSAIAGEKLAGVQTDNVLAKAALGKAVTKGEIAGEVVDVAMDFAPGIKGAKAAGKLVGGVVKAGLEKGGIEVAAKVTEQVAAGALKQVGGKLAEKGIENGVEAFAGKTVVTGIKIAQDAIKTGAVAAGAIKGAEKLAEAGVKQGIKYGKHAIKEEVVTTLGGPQKSQTAGAEGPNASQMAIAAEQHQQTAKKSTGLSPEMLALQEKLSGAMNANGKGDLAKLADMVKDAGKGLLNADMGLKVAHRDQVPEGKQNIGTGQKGPQQVTV